jgi:hypothetical protein
MVALRGVPQESDALLRQIDGYLAMLRTPGTSARHLSVTTVRAVDLGRAEQVAEALRRLVDETALASAADRARVRAAVHCFVSGGVPLRTRLGGGRYALVPWLRVDTRASRRPRAQRRVSELLRELGRPDLIVDDPA